MEKVARFLPLVLFCVFSIKLINQDYFDIPEAMILMIMAALSAFVQHGKSEEFKELKLKLEKLENVIEKDARESLILKKELEDTKALIGGIKLGQQLKSQMNRN